MAVMPLLTPSETLKFESALHGFSETLGPEWAMYTGDHELKYADQLPPRKEGSEQLAKATKDLMSLDTRSLRWNESADRDVLSLDLPTTSPITNASHSSHTSHNATHFRPLGLHMSAFSDHSLFSHFPSHVHQNFLGSSMSSLQRPPLTISPNHMFDSSSNSDSQRSLSSVSTDPTPPPPTPPSLKRPYPSSSDLVTIAGPSSVPTPSMPRPQAKRARASSSISVDSAQSRQTLTPDGQSPGGSGARPTLLTPSQKKANHIQSEQKRRANIRRGYEALCETVPALREAIRLEEEEIVRAQTEAQADSVTVGKSKRKARTKRGTNTGESGEKTDGRAGPRSENVVLQKSMFCLCLTYLIML